MNMNTWKYKLAMTILIALSGLGLLALTLNALNLAPFLILSSVSWNA